MVKTQESGHAYPSAQKQNHRTVGVGIDLWRPSSPTPNPLVPCGRLHPGGLWVSPEEESPQPLCAACSLCTLTVKFFLAFVWNFPCCGFCPFSLFCPFDSPLDIYKHWRDPLPTFPPPGWTAPELSAFHMGDASGPSSSLWPRHHLCFWAVTHHRLAQHKELRADVPPLFVEPSFTGKVGMRDLKASSPGPKSHCYQTQVGKRVQMAVAAVVTGH